MKGKLPISAWRSDASAGYTFFRNPILRICIFPACLLLLISYGVKANPGLGPVFVKNTVATVVAPTLTLEITAPASATCGDQITVNITAISGFTDLVSLQHSIGWDETELQYVSHSATTIGGPGGEPQIGTGNGEMTYSWADPGGTDGENLADGTLLMSITFQVLSSSGTANVDITGSPLILEVANNLFEIGTIIPQNNAAVTLSPISVTLTLVDDLACPNETTLTLDGGFPAGGTYSGPGVSGNNFDATVAGPGVHTITYTYTDGNGCSNSATDDITVEDVNPPAITCPASVSQDADANCAYTVSGTGLDATATDNCLVSSVLNDFNGGATLDGAVFPPGITTVTWTATDGSGLTATCSFGVTVTDVTPPAVTCAASVSQNADAACAYTVSGTGLDATVTDNCPASSVLNDYNSTATLDGAVFPLGVTTVTWTATDGAGLTATCSFDITVTDATPPAITCPASVSQNADANCEYVVSGTGLDASPTDNCSVSGILNDFNGSATLDGAVFPTGATTVIWTATDGAGLTATCAFEITVADGTPPTISCPPALEQFADANCAYVVSGTGLDATPSDNCSVSGVLNDFNGTSTLDGAAFPLGNTTVIWTATDGAGLTATCAFDIVVVDATAPEITCPAPAPQNADANCEYVVSGTALDATATDNCTVDGIENDFTNSPTLDGAVFPLGATVVTWTTKDGAGLTATCSMTVTVNDVTPPGITCPSPVSQNADAGCEYTVSGTSLDATATDNCTVSTVLNDYNSTATLDGAVFPLGTTTVVWTATDGAGLTATCAFDITVSDATPPSITCPVASVSENADATCRYIVSGTGLDASGSDNCDLDGITNDYTNTATLDGTPFAPGVTVVTWTATDAGGLTATCTIEVTVTDVTPPNITCPASVSQNADANCAYVVSGTGLDASVTDNCSGSSVLNDLTATATLDGAVFPLGNTTVTWTATDAAGLTATCTFVVTVTDATPPGITCPSSVSQSADANCEYVVSGTGLDATATDNCSGSSSTNDYNSTATLDGAAFPLGITVVTWTVTDGAGLTSSCTYAVSVNDATPPVITCPVASVTENADAACEYTVSGTDLDATSTDNCSIASISNDYTATSTLDGAVFPLGTTVVTWITYDGAENNVTCTVEITVTDATPPAIICPVATVNENADANCEYLHSGTGLDASATDNCDLDGITNDFTNTVTLDGAAFPLGVTVVSWTATDAAGLTSTCTVQVTVTDITPPVITCPVATVAENADANCEYTVSGNGLDASATDNCQVVSVLNDYSGTNTLDAAVFTAGVTTVTWTATDNSGLTSTCTLEVTVTDVTPPTVTCPAPDTVYADLDCDFDVTGTAFDVTLANTTDNCGVVTIVNDYNGLASLDGAAFYQDSTTVITWTVTDGGGNTASCTTTITVQDTTPPVVAYTFPTSYNVDVTSGDCSAVVTIERPILASLCPIPIPFFDNFTVNDCDLAYLAPVEGPAIVNGVPDPNFLNAVPALDICDPTKKFVALQFPVGTTEIPYVWCDSLGNCDTIVISVTVNENGLPVAECEPGVVTLPLDAAGVAVVTPDLVNAGSGDNCGIDSSWVFPDTLRCIDAGPNLVTLTVRDKQGNTSTCTATVDVVDDLPPVVNCPTDFIASTGNASCEALAADIPSLALTEIPADSSLTAPGQYLDNCGVTGITYTLSGPSGTTGSGNYPVPGNQVFNRGLTTVTYTFLDAEGNSVSCSFNITVEDLTPPSTLNCPNPAPVNANTGGCIAIVSWTPPTFTDNCPGNLIVTSSHNPGAFFFFDTTLVTYTAIDAAGNVGTCTFNVVVNDVQAPVAKCKDLTVSLNASGVVTVNPSQLDNGSTDNCFYNYVNLPAVYNCTHAGTNDYTLVIEDAGGNRDSATCTLTVTDLFSPDIVNCGAVTLPEVNLDANCQGTLDAVAFSGNFAITDNTLNSVPSCPLTYAVDVDGSGFAATYTWTCADAGNNTVTLRVTDVFGNGAVCIKTVTVKDVTPPVIPDANAAAPPAVTVECSDYDPNDFAVLGEITQDDVSDACDDACDRDLTITFNDVTAADPNCQNQFTVTRTWTVSDQAGNSATHVQTISVKDTQAPVITGVQPLISVEANNQNEAPACVATTTVEISPFNIEDNCTDDFADFDISYLIDFAPLGVGNIATGNGAAVTANFPLGVSHVTFTVSDPCGNSSQVTITVQVNDVDGPVVNEPFGEFFGNTQNVCGQTFSVLNATDNCGNNFTWYRPYQNGSEADFLDCSGFTVTETISDPTVQSSINVSSPFVFLNPPIFSVHPVAFFPVGQTVITYTATDTAGNTSTCAFTVEILDTQAPTISCPNDQNLSITAGCANATTTPGYLNGIQITDNCPDNVLLTQMPAAGTPLASIVDTVKAGKTFTVTVFAKDSFPNNLGAQPCTFTVTLSDGDAPVPVLAFLPPIITFCGQDTVEAPSALDCNGISFDTIYGTPSVPVQGILPPVTPGGPPRYILNGGNYAITWSYTDPQNNTTTQLQSVQILPDVNLPLAICHVPFTVELSPAGDYGLTLPEIDNGSYDPDACGPVDKEINPAVLNCANLNTPVTVTLTVTDVAGNTAQCTVTVTVEDVTAPVLSPIPANDTLEACTPIPAPPAITASDVCDLDIAVQYDQDTITFANPYQFTLRRTWTATDDSGNSSQGTQIITILDTQSPVFAGVPDTIVVLTDLNSQACKDTVAFNVAPYVEDCDSTALVITNSRTNQGANYSEILDIGTYTLIFTAKDINNNSATKTIVLIVRDGTDPIAACINGISVSLQGSGSVTVTSANINANSSDNCTPQNLLDLKIQRLDPLGPVTTSITFTCPDADGVTQHPVRLYVKDQGGNEATCETYIVVQDNTVPVITCPPGKTVQCTDDLSPAIQGTATATDNCLVGSVSFTDVEAAGSGNFCFQVLRTWKAFDQAQNQATCLQTFNVQDTVKPVFTLVPGDLNLSCGDTLAQAPDVQATDNCSDSVTVVLAVDTTDTAQGNCGLYSYTLKRTWTATDACGNSRVITQQVTVTDTLAPVLTGLPDTLTVNSADFPANANCTVQVTLDVRQYLEDCQHDSLLTVTNNAPHGDGAGDISGDYTVGVYHILFTVADACGNTGTDSLVLRVIDNSIPTAICNDNVVIALGTNGSATLPVSAVDLGSNDNCGIDTMYLSQADFDCSDLGNNEIQLIVVDASGNSNTCTVTVQVDPGPNTGFTLTTTATPESISGANDGTATAIASGGSGQFGYEWSNSDTTATITGLPPGFYSVTVTDLASGCQQIDTVLVETGAKITLTAGAGAGAASGRPRIVSGK